MDTTKSEAEMTEQKTPATGTESQWPQQWATQWSAAHDAGAERYVAEVGDRVTRNELERVTLPVRVTLLREEWVQLSALANLTGGSLDGAVSDVLGDNVGAGVLVRAEGWLEENNSNAADGGCEERHADLPPEMEQAAEERASALGMSFNDYLLDLMQRDLRDNVLLRVDIKPDLAERLDKLSQASGKSREDLIREALLHGVPQA